MERKETKDKKDSKESKETKDKKESKETKDSKKSTEPIKLPPGVEPLTSKWYSRNENGDDCPQCLNLAVYNNRSTCFFHSKR